MREKQQIFRYAGYEMRSHSETRWAALMDSIGISWLYEPQVVTTRHGHYLPDFFLPAVEVFVEVKGPGPTEVEVEKAQDAECSTGFPVIFAHGKPEMIAAELVHGAVSYFNGEKRITYSTKELGAIVRGGYDTRTYAAFLCAGEHQGMPDSFSAGEILDEVFARMMDRQDLEKYRADLHRPLNQAKRGISKQHSRAEWFLGKFAEKARDWRQGRSANA